MYYFAYGSNMSQQRLRARVPSAVCLGVTKLAGHQLRFHKRGQDLSAKADAYFTGNENDAVIGVLYRINPAERGPLDQVEGVGFGYDTKAVQLPWEGSIVTAYTYIAIHLDPSLLPFHWYKHHVLLGAKEACLPESYIEQIQAQPSKDDPDRERHMQEVGIYRR